MYLTVAQFAKESGVSAPIIYRFIKTGHIKAEAVVIGGYLRIMVDSAIYNPKTFKANKRGRKRKV